MDNHAILAPALQKYYSALKSLDEFGQCGNFFDDVSNLDKFFSEFRNVTFVVQKGLGSEENKAIYAELRSNFLSGDTLKWFVDTRNKTTKEKPFDLRKELNIDLYLPNGMYSVKDTRLIVDFDTSFNDALVYIRSVFFDKLKLAEVFFTSRIIFREAGSEINLYPKIKDGILQMNKFIGELENRFPCKCEICAELKKKTIELSRKVQSKELALTRDYSLENGKDPRIGDQAEMYLSKDGIVYAAQSDLRLSLDNPVFKEAQGCLKELFLRFASMHTMIFQMQKHEIMPVFMLVYRNQTYRMIPFVATSKATFYRKVIELIGLSDFDEVDSVFYCGEYYCYDAAQFSAINETPYSERIGMAQKEVLAFVMIARENCEMLLSFDESKVDDIKYVAEQFKKASWNEAETVVPFDWLNPIRQRFSEESLRQGNNNS